MFTETSKELLNFIEKSPSCFHAILAIKDELNENSFEELFESKKRNIEKGKKYYVTRNLSSIVIKYNANQKYTTDAVSSALFKDYCKNADVPYQNYTNRSDMPGGSTLGNIASAQVSIKMVDIGLAQLSMHSSYETAGIKDTYYMIKVLEEFYNSHIEETEGEVWNIYKK